MRKSMRIVAAGSLVALGYFMGNCHVFRTVQAQQEEELPSAETVKKIVESYAALRNAAQGLAAESRYNSITKVVNPFSVLIGGLNVKEDLESGQGVDPETYAALSVAVFDRKKNAIKDEKSENENDFADWVTENKNEVLNRFAYDSNGRLTYNNKVVRMYSIAKLRRLNAQRLVVLGLAREQKPTK